MNLRIRKQMIESTLAHENPTWHLCCFQKDCNRERMIIMKSSEWMIEKVIYFLSIDEDLLTGLVINQLKPLSSNLLQFHFSSSKLQEILRVGLIKINCSSCLENAFRTYYRLNCFENIFIFSFSRRLTLNKHTNLRIKIVFFSLCSME